MNENQSQTESLLDIIKGVDQQNILLPEFQRDFRWELNQTYELFDSLIREIFIGTVIYGKPSFGMTLREIDQRPRKGRGSNAPLKTIDYSTAEITRKAQTHNLRVVLDGQQRITSIYRAIKGLDAVYIILREDLDPNSIAQLALEDIVADVAGEESATAISVKLADAYDAEIRDLDDDDLNQSFAQSMYARQQFANVSDESFKAAARTYRRALKKLIDLYKQQKMVAFYLLDMSLEKFCIFFERSNSRGIQLNFTDILAAKLYRGFNLRKKIEEFESTSKLKLNREIIVRAIAYIVGSERGGAIAIDKKFILENLEAEDFTAYWDSTCALYAESLHYLISQHYILSQDWMPSENMIIPIMIFRRHLRSFDQMTEEQRRFLEWWYWSSIFSNRYSSASNEAIIIDSSALTQIVHGRRISVRGYFTRMRSLITEPEDLFSYTKRSSGIYKGILNLLGYAAKGLRDWNSIHKIDINMRLEDHHIYPRAYISSAPKLDIDQGEAEQLVDCVVNRTLIPKLLNIQIGKKAPQTYLSEVRTKSNPQLATSIQGHLLPNDMITDSGWNECFKMFLEDRSNAIFALIEQMAIAPTSDMITRYGTQVDVDEDVHRNDKVKLKDMIASGRVQVGERVYVRKQPTRFAKIIDGETVEFEGQTLSINTWGQQMMGWSSINIYDYVLLARTNQPLKTLRDEPSDSAT